MMKWILAGFYGPAIALLGWQIWHLGALDQRLLSMAIFLLSLDLWIMAIFDLQQVARVRALLVSDARLDRFYAVTMMTIVVEWVGMYGAQGSLWVGAAVILMSQIGFNLFAGVQLLPDQTEPIVIFGIRDRALVLVADSVGVGLVSLGMAGVMPLGMASGLLGMVIIYGGVKIVDLLKDLTLRSSTKI